MRPAQVDLPSILSDALARESAFTSEYDVVVSQATKRICPDAARVWLADKQCACVHCKTAHNWASEASPPSRTTGTNFQRVGRLSM